MRYLLDTHAFLWFDNQPAKLSPQVAKICQNKSNALLLSLVSIWEIQIKVQLGKLNLPASLLQIVTNQQKANQIELLPITFAHILGLDGLPFHHNDPFDRLLIGF